MIYQRWFYTVALISIAIFFGGPTVVCASENPNAQEHKIDAVEQEERQILEDLEAIDRRLTEIEDSLLDVEIESGELKERLLKNDRNIQNLEKQVKEMRKYIAGRLRAMYRLKDGGVLRIMLDSESLPDLAKRYRFLTFILKRDRTALEELAAATGQLEKRKADLGLDQNKMASLKKDLVNQQKELVQAKNKKTLLLMKVHRKKELYLAMIESEEQSRRKLLKEVIVPPINDQQHKEVRTSPETKAPKENKSENKEIPREWPNVNKLKGKIPRPVPGKVVKTFGKHPGPFNTVTERRGWTFETSEGAKIKAVLNGEVLYTGWLKGYGNIIIIDHGQRYYTLTAGLSGLKHKAGQWVVQGEVIGQTPKGGAAGKKEIYFEIRHGSHALNPARWLGSKPLA